LLRAKGVSMAFGGLQALAEVDLDLAPGEVHALVGPNGSGKTTLVNVLTGFYRPQKGEVYLEGRPITRFPPWLRARLGLARTFQTPQLPPGLCTRAYLRLVGLEPQEAMKAGLPSGALALPVDELPWGHRRILELLRALALKPRYLLLDEPASGLTPLERERLADTVRSLAAQGLGVLVVEHDMAFVRRVASRVSVLNAGLLLAHGGLEVLERPEVVAAYLGEGYVV